MTSQQEPPYDLAALFHSEVSDDLLKDICRAICRGHQQAYAYVSVTYRKEQAHDAFPHALRAHTISAY